MKDGYDDDDDCSVFGCTVTHEPCVICDVHAHVCVCVCDVSANALWRRLAFERYYTPGDPSAFSVTRFLEGAEPVSWGR